MGRNCTGRVAAFFIHWQAEEGSRVRDPLVILTAVVSAALLAVFGRYAVTGVLDEKILTGLGAILGSLITALSTRKKDGDKDDDSNPS